MTNVLGLKSRLARYAQVLETCNRAEEKKTLMDAMQEDAMRLRILNCMISKTGIQQLNFEDICEACYDNVNYSAENPYCKQCRLDKGLEI